MAILLVLLLSWLLFGRTLAASVTLFILAVIGVVPLLAVLNELVRKPIDLPVFTHLSVTASAWANSLASSCAPLFSSPTRRTPVLMRSCGP